MPCAWPATKAALLAPSVSFMPKGNMDGKDLGLRLSCQK